MQSILTTGSIPRHLVRLTIPSIAGAMAIIAFNLTDTYFVSRLGTIPLAAMGFTFPVVMVVGAIAMGISMGSSSILARAMGAGDRDKMRKTATFGLLLTLAITGLIGLIGLITLKPLFLALGADENTLPLVRGYMTIWYAGCIVVMTPPVGDGNLRATGDMIRPSIVMFICAIGNIILDPIFIWGLGPIPAMGIRGAALATVLSRGFGMAATLVFNAKSGLLDFSRPNIIEVFSTWRRILFIGVPAAVAQLLPSALRSTLTILTATIVGATGVAALAAGTRIESIPLMMAWAFNTAILTVVAQNYGAGRYERVDAVRRTIIRYGFIYGFFLTAIVWPSAPALARIFTDDPAVAKITVLYLRIYFTSAVSVLVFNWFSVALNAVGRPIISLWLNLVGIGFLMIPGAFIGRFAWPADPFVGMMVGLAVGNVFAGTFAWIVGRRFLKHDV
jgi:putative MATE family efflux protein